MRTLRFLAAVVGLCWAVGAIALERDAAAIESAGIEYRAYKDMDAIRLTIMGEASVRFESDWAIVAGVGAGQLQQSGEDSPNLWYAALGVKWYVLPTTPLQLLATYDWTGSGENFGVLGGTLSVEHRLTSQESSIVPFVGAGVAIQSAKTSPWMDTDSATVLVMSGTVGCDFLIGKDVALVFQGSYIVSSDLSDDSDYGDYADGWSGGLALKYFWH